MSEHDEKDEMIRNDTLQSDVKDSTDVSKVITDGQADELLALMRNRVNRGADLESDRCTIQLIYSYRSLQKERDELAARCERLRPALEKCSEWIGAQKVSVALHDKKYTLAENMAPAMRLLDQADIALREATAASLAHVRYQTLEDMLIELRDNAPKSVDTDTWNWMFNRVRDRAGSFHNQHKTECLQSEDGQEVSNG